MTNKTPIRLLIQSRINRLRLDNLTDDQIRVHLINSEGWSVAAVSEVMEEMG